MKINYKQRGNTMLGFIAGVVSGLVVAVIIAMIVTKASMPFTQKHTKQGKIAESASTASAESNDPNKPLYSTVSAPKVSAKASAKEHTPNTHAETKEAPRTVTRAEPVYQAPSDDDPIADKIKQKSTTPAAHKFDDRGDEKWTYMLQTNAYRDQAEAQNERARLALSGFESKISETNISGTLLYRVRIGPFPSLDAMNQMRNKLSDSGVNAAVVRIPKQ